MRLALGVVLFLVVVVAGSLAWVTQDRGPQIDELAVQPAAEHEATPPRRARTIWDAPERPPRNERRHAHSAAWPPDGPTGSKLIGPHVAESSAVLHRRRARRGPVGGPPRLRVRVFDAETGAALPDAMIHIDDGAQSVATARHDGVVEWGAAVTVDVTVAHPGRAVLCERAIELDDGADLVLDVQLVRGRQVALQLVGRQGASVAGREVGLWRAEEWDAAWPVRPLPSPVLNRTADEAGRATFDGVPRLSRWVVAVRGTDVRTGAEELRVGPDLAPLWLTLNALPDSTLRGRVVDRTGDPVEGAWVFADPPSRPTVSTSESPEARSYRALLQPDRNAARWLRNLQRARTDASGAFELAGGVPTHPTTLLAIHPEFGTSELVPARFPVRGGSQEVAPIVLRGRGRLVVEVVDAKLGSPVEGAELTVPSSDRVATLPEQSPGVYGPVSLPVGEVEIHVSEPSLGATTVVRRIEPIGITNVRIDASPTFIFRGWTLDEAGTPLAGVRVEASEAWGEAVSDRDGEFAFFGIPPDSHCLLVASAPGHAPLRADVRAELASIELRLARARSVQLRLVPPDPARPPGWVALDTGIGPPEVVLGWSDSDRVLNAVDPRRRSLTIWAEGCSTARVQIPAWALDQRNQPFVVRLEPALAIVGRVENETGAPIADALVLGPRADPLHDGRTFVRSDRAGRFEFVGVSSGPPAPRLTVSATGFRTAWVDETPIRSGDRHVLADPIVLRRRAKVAVDHRPNLVRAQVWREEGVPCAGERVVWPGGHTTTDALGFFEADPLPVPVSLTIGGKRVHVDALPREGETLVIRLDGR